MHFAFWRRRFGYMWWKNHGITEGEALQRGTIYVREGLFVCRGRCVPVGGCTGLKDCPLRRTDLAITGVRWVAGCSFLCVVCYACTLVFSGTGLLGLTCPQHSTPDTAAPIYCVFFYVRAVGSRSSTMLKRHVLEWRGGCPRPYYCGLGVRHVLRRECVFRYQLPPRMVHAAGGLTLEPKIQN